MKSTEKIDVDKICDRAVELFYSGWNCAESVFIALSETFASKDKIPVNLLTSLGGGIGDSGFSCGALTGAIISIGIKYGRKKPDAEAKEKAYRISSDILNDFKNIFQSIDCRELKKENEGSARRKEICSGYVREATYLAVKAILMKENTNA